MKVWDGTSGTRIDPLVRKGPDGDDWRTITAELQATQKFVANLASNADVMPDLVGDIESKQGELESLQEAIAGLTLPEDVKARIDVLEEDLIKLHRIYTHAAEVLQTVNFLQRQLLNLGRRIDKHVEETARKSLAFENRVANWQRANEDRWHSRLEKAEEQLGAISLALGLKTYGEE
jgi:conjugal transfer/entry exclusion protein